MIIGIGGSRDELIFVHSWFSNLNFVVIYYLYGDLIVLFQMIYDFTLSLPSFFLDGNKMAPVVAMKMKTLFFTFFLFIPFPLIFWFSFLFLLSFVEALGKISGEFSVFLSMEGRKQVSFLYFLSVQMEHHS